MQKPQLIVSKRSLFVFLLAGCLSILSILYIISRMDVDAITKSFAQVNLNYLLVSACITIGMQLIASLRWQILLNHRLPYLQALSALLLGFFVNAILPFRIGELVRAQLINRHKITMSEAIPTIVLGQILDVLVLVVFGIFLIALGTFPPQLVSTLLIVGCIALSVLVLFYVITSVSVFSNHQLQATINRYIGDKAVRIASGIIAQIQTGLGTLNNPIQFLHASILSFVFWLALVCANWILALSLIESPSLLIGVMLAFASGLGRLIPALPGDIGTLDVLVVVSIRLFGVTEDTALTVMLLIRIRYMINVIIGGIIGLLIEGSYKAISSVNTNKMN